MIKTSDFRIENGVLTKYTGPGGDVVIPDGVTEISHWAFMDCQNLYTVIIPESVTSIGLSAFNSCINLNGVKLPEYVKEIGSWAFCGCSALTNVEIPDSVSNIGKRAFMNCPKLEISTFDGGKYLGNKNNPYLYLAEREGSVRCNIHPDTKIINSEAFKNCTAQDYVSIPENVIINSDAQVLSCCFGAAHVMLETDDPEYIKIFFKNNPAAASYTFPKTHFKALPNESKNKAVLGYVYTNYHKLAEFGAEIEKEYKAALKRRRKDLYGTEVAWEELFSVLKEDKLISYDELDSLLIRFSENAELCAALKEYQNNISTPTTRKKETKKNAGKTELAAGSAMSLQDYKKLWNFSKLEDGSIAISYYKGDENIVYVPSTIGNVPVTVIKDYAFAVNGARKTPKDMIREIHIPEGVTSIGNGAFKGCVNLEKISVPDSLCNIGSNAFESCGKLKFTEYDGFGYLGGPNTPYRFAAIHLGKPDCSLHPDTEHLLVGAFERSRGPQNLIVSDKVTRIMNYNFKGCLNLIHIELPKTIMELGRFAFESCRHLTDIEIPSGPVKIPDACFRGCVKLGKVTVSDTVQSIGYSAFKDCAELKTVEIPASVSAIDSWSFIYCDNLTIHAPAGSYAEQYAAENNISFVAAAEKS